MDYSSKIVILDAPNSKRMSVFSNIKTMWIIHSFAFMHAAVALSCRMTGIEDELLLTMLTMAMALLICFRKNFSIEFTASVIIIVNIIGYLLGTVGAELLSKIINNPYAVHAVSTALTTEILGWCVVGTSRLFPNQKRNSRKKMI